MNILIIILWILGTLVISSIAAVVSKKYGVEYLIGMYAACIVITAVIANKMVMFGSYTVSASIIVFSVTFFLTDILSEFWGKKEATKAVWAGFLADIMLLFMLYVATNWTPASFWTGQEAFVQTLGTTGRVIAASLIAYIIAQNHDVWAYHFWKKTTKGKHLWLRNLLSTGGSQVIDSILFVSIAFYGIFPVMPVILSTIVVKFVIAILDTPFIYAVRFYFERVKPYKRAKVLL